VEVEAHPAEVEVRPVKVEVEVRPVKVEVEVRRVEVEAEVEAVALDPRVVVVVVPLVVLDVANASASRVTAPRPPSSWMQSSRNTQRPALVTPILRPLVTSRWLPNLVVVARAVLSVVSVLC